MASQPSKTPTIQEYLNADSVIEHLLGNLAIEAQLKMEGWNIDTMQRHVNKRASLIAARRAILAETERLIIRSR